ADPTTLTLDEAIALLAAKTQGQDGSRSTRIHQGRLLGEHPEGGSVSVRNGRFGSYVNFGKVNATLKKGLSAETITLEEAIRLIEEKEGLSQTKKGAKKKSQGAVKSTAKTQATVKAGAKTKDPSGPDDKKAGRVKNMGAVKRGTAKRSETESPMVNRKSVIKPATKSKKVGQA
ncbi:MAG: DNA topoisomerase I, partial [Alphaproteobacteria bacterium]|nr:DNA topoisomerase I [Alphaproteobacteria bacterium]